MMKIRRYSASSLTRRDTDQSTRVVKCKNAMNVRKVYGLKSDGDTQTTKSRWCNLERVGIRRWSQVLRSPSSEVWRTTALRLGRGGKIKICIRRMWAVADDSLKIISGGKATLPTVEEERLLITIIIISSSCKWVTCHDTAYHIIVACCFHLLLCCNVIHMRLSTFQNAQRKSLLTVVNNRFTLKKQKPVNIFEEPLSAAFFAVFSSPMTHRRTGTLR